MHATIVAPNELPFRILARFLPEASAVPAELMLAARTGGQALRQCRGPLAAMLRLLQDYCAGFPIAELRFEQGGSRGSVASVRCCCNEPTNCPYGATGPEECPTATLCLRGAAGG